MRILIVSDTHRLDDNFFQAVEDVGEIDMVIHCGDAEGSEYELQKAADVPLYIVRGNNDFFSDLEDELELEIEGKRILVTHGHYHHVSTGVEYLLSDAEQRNFDVVMFGHIHRPMIKEYGDLVILNPGSLSYPRQDGRAPSYIIMETDGNGEFDFTIEYL